jgi:hypothetical protein
MTKVSVSERLFRIPPDIVAGLGRADIAALGTPAEAEHLAADCARTERQAFPSSWHCRATAWRHAGE